MIQARVQVRVSAWVHARVQIRVWTGFGQMFRFCLG